MHEPARRGFRRAVEPLPVEPEAAAVARPRRGNNRASARPPHASATIPARCVPGPPTRGDPVERAPPAEIHRRPLRHFGGRHLDRLGRTEQPDRPLRREDGCRRRRLSVRLLGGVVRCGASEKGMVATARSGRWLSTSDRLQHRTVAEPGADAVGEQRDVGAVIRRSRRSRSACCMSKAAAASTESRTRSKP